MLNEYIQSQYIVFPCGLARPALVITIAYLLLLAVIVLYGIIKKDFKLIFPSICKMKKGDKNKVFLSVIGFAVMVISCIVLPLLLDSENAIITISKVYLKYETIAFLGILLFLASSIFIKSNREKQVIAANKIIKVLIWISIGTGIITSEIDYSYWPNIIIIVGSGVLTGFFSIVNFEAVPKENEKIDRFDLVPYSPASNIKSLFDYHKNQAEDISNIIIKSSSEPFSVCISGGWGTGKTSVVNGVIEMLERKNPDAYDFVYINALELDNKQAMIHYLFSQIKEKLKSRGVYVGIDSEIKDFISSAAGAITSTSIGDLIHKKFFCENDDYRFQKEKLEEVIHRAYGDGKLVVVVDDIERCDQEHARDYLFLIKEVATMKSCVSIFVTDYNMLNNLVSMEKIETESEKCDFSSKFFNYRIDLRTEPPENIFEFYDKYFNTDDPAFQSIYKFICISPLSWYRNVMDNMNLKIEKERANKDKHYYTEDQREEFDRKIKKLDEKLSLFYNYVQNPRNVAKFYNIFRNNIFVCDTLMRFLVDESETKKYIDSRNIGQLLYVLSFAEVFMPMEYQTLAERGSKYAEFPLYGSNETVGKERALLIELMAGLVYGEYSEYQKPNAYIKQDIRNFLEMFLENKRKVPELVNVFSSQDEKWITAINEDDYKEIKNNWDGMILMVLRHNPYIKREIKDLDRKKMFSKLLDFAKKEVEKGDWTSDKLFSIFDSEMHSTRLFSTGTGLLSTFYSHLQNSNIYQRPSERLVKEVKDFPYHYTYDRMTSIYRLARYLIPYENDYEEMTSYQEYMLNINRNFSENISIFLDKIATHIPDCKLSNDSWIEKYKDLASRIIEYLEQLNLTKYPDVKDDIEIMMDSIDEFSSLEKIISWLDNRNDKNYMALTNINSCGIDQAIQCFEFILNSESLEKVAEFDKSFFNFFTKLRNEKDLALSEVQIGRLHDLITMYVKQTGYSGMSYRRVLIKIAPKNNDGNDSNEE